MNEWTEKSIELVNIESGYLDRLSEVYPVSINQKRPLPEDVKVALKSAYERHDAVEMIELLLESTSGARFPIKDPYVAFLKKEDTAVYRNPETVERLYNRVKAIGVDTMIAEIEQPIEANRQIGAQFSQWLRQMSEQNGYPFLSAKELHHMASGIAFLEGSDRILHDFLSQHLNCELSKYPDFVAKVDGQYVVGEAKFLTDYGGHQDRQLDDALSLLDVSCERVIMVAVLDGIVWIPRDVKMHRMVTQTNDRPIFSALLLRDFLEDLRN